MHLNDYVEKAASLAPHHPALISAGTTMSFASLAARVNEVTASLAALNLAPGSTVAILSDNCAEVCIAQLAINQAGLAWTSVHPSVTAETTAEVLSYLDAKFVFFQARYEEKARVALGGVRAIVGAVCLDAASSCAPSLSEWQTPTPRQGLAEPGCETTGWLQHTGGAGGPCHGTYHSRAAIEIGLANVADALDADASARHLVVAPLTHAAGIFALAFVSVGATTVIEDHFSAERVDAALRDDGITHVFLPPTALYALLDHVKGPAKYPSLRCMLVAGAPVAPERFEQAVSMFGPVLYEVFGQTETLLALVKRPRDYMRGGALEPRIARSAGKPVRFARVALLDDDGQQVAVGERGEIAVRSSMLMKGYHRKPELTARSRRIGWHLTGDVGVADAEGYVTIVDRKREMIVSGSFNVFPTEVEEILRLHGDVADCAVIGIPDPRWGEAVHAIVAGRGDARLDQAVLVQWCKQRLGSVKAPKSIEVVALADLPRDAGGAIDKARLKAPYWDGQWRRV